MINSMLTGGLFAALRTMRFFSSTAFVASLMLIAGAAHAQYGPDDEAEALEAMKPKVEAEVTLPPMPKPQDLIAVDTGPTARQSFAIDAKSLTVSADHVVRYTVIATSSSGSQNISYEGIDCKMREFKRYAYGSKDGKWTRSRRDKWERVSSLSQNQFHFTLYTQYLCQAGLATGNASDLLKRIRYNRVLNY